MEVDQLEYAGFWIRLGATLVDTILIMVISVPLLVWIYGSSYLGDGRLIHGPAEFLISWVAPSVATILFWRYKEATPGKMMLSLRIVDAQSGETPSIGQLIGRYFAYLVSGVVLCLGFLWIAFDRKKQGWHDKLAGTVVVRSKYRGPDPVRFNT